MIATESSPYILGRTSHEYARLRQQARVWEPATKSVLERAGIAPGMRCLDAGSGPGEVMRLMAQYAGPTGMVVGLDVDANIGAEAIVVLHGLGLRRCRFVQGDIFDMEQLDEGPFDFVFARLLLMHLERPAEALRKLYRWLKPGGRIVVQDFETGVVDAEPRLAVMDEFKAVWSGICRKTGRDQRFGLRIPALFAEAGIGRPDGTDVAGLFLPMEVSCHMLTAVYRSLLPFASDLGLVTQERSDWFFDEAEKPEWRDHYCRWPLLISAWKQKPLLS